ALTRGARVAPTLVVVEAARPDVGLAAAPNADPASIDRMIAAERTPRDGQRRCGVAEDCTARAVDAGPGNHVARERAAVDCEICAQDARDPTAASDDVGGLIVGHGHVEEFEASLVIEDAAAQCGRTERAVDSRAVNEAVRDGQVFDQYIC